MASGEPRRAGVPGAGPGDDDLRFRGRASRALNALYIKEGRTAAPGLGRRGRRQRPFAQAHRLRPGDRIGAVINGKRKALQGRRDRPVPGIRVPGRARRDPPGFRSGTASCGCGGKGWPRRTGWRGRSTTSSRRFRPGAAQGDVLRRLDVLLAPYGGLGAYGAGRPGLPPVPVRGVPGAGGHGLDLPRHLPGRGGVPAERVGEPAGEPAAGPDRHPEGLRLDRTRPSECIT